MTTLTQMREAVALLPADDPIRKALIWADMELGDRYDQICELEDELSTLSDQYADLVESIHQAKAVIDGLGASLTRTLWQPELPAVDHAPYINCMAAQGVEPYAKAKRKTKKEAA